MAAAVLLPLAGMALAFQQQASALVLGAGAVMTIVSAALFAGSWIAGLLLAILAAAVVIVPDLQREPLPDRVILFALTAVALLLCQRRIGLAHSATRQWQDIARRDPLTGAGNRLAFEQHLATTLERRDASTSLWLLAIDLDGLKALNDTNGHATGDAALSELVKRVRCLVRQDDSVARIGGDEFALLLSGASRTRVNAIVDALQDGFALRDQPDILVSATTGTVEINSAMDATAAIAAADAALIRRKAAQRGECDLSAADLTHKGASREPRA